MLSVFLSRYLTRICELEVMTCVGDGEFEMPQPPKTVATFFFLGDMEPRVTGPHADMHETFLETSLLFLPPPTFARDNVYALKLQTTRCARSDEDSNATIQDATA